MHLSAEYPEPGIEIWCYNAALTRDWNPGLQINPSLRLCVAINHKQLYFAREGNSDFWGFLIENDSDIIYLNGRGVASS